MRSELPIEQCSENTAVAGVPFAVKGPKVREIVTSAERLWDGIVINFPPVWRALVSVVFVFYPGAEIVISPNGGIRGEKATWNDMALLPDG